MSDIEFSRLPAERHREEAGRLERLLNDADAMTWLRYEVSGYTPPADGYMTEDEVVAAERSHRRFKNADGDWKYIIESLGQMTAHIDSGDGRGVLIRWVGCSTGLA